MASEIRVDKINSLSGVGTVTLSPTGVDISGITTVSTLKVGTGLTASSDGNVFFTGIATATTFSGSGANLTALPAASLTGTVADARFPATLPAISALNLTNVPAANVVGVHTSLTVTNATTTGTAVVGGGVTISESGIEASGIGITCANINGQQVGGRRNIVINGAMNVAQRGTSSTTTSGYNVTDRFFTNASNFDQLAATISQDSESPDGFAKSLKWATTTPETTIDSNESLYIGYKFEGQDLQQLNYNESSATDFTISFYVKTSITGTYSLTIYRDEPGTDRICNRTYTVPDTNWHRYTFTVAGDTSRVIQNDTSSRMRLMFHIAAGSDYTSSTSSTWVDYGNEYFAGGHAANGVATTDNATFYLTGVQLEVGSQATAFEHRSFGEELALCQRYCYVIRMNTGDYSGFIGQATSADAGEVCSSFPVPMRDEPTYTGSATNCRFQAGNSSSQVQFNALSIYRVPIHRPVSIIGLRDVDIGSMTQGEALMLHAMENNGKMTFDSEL